MKLNKKKIKSLSQSAKDINLEQTPNVAGGLNIPSLVNDCMSQGRAFFCESLVAHCFSHHADRLCVEH